MTTQRVLQDLAQRIACCMLLIVFLAPASPHSAEFHKFKTWDSVTGLEVACSQCPPGQFLRRACTEQSESVCEDCPPESYTALWNHIGRCLRCSVCSQNMVQSTDCTPRADRTCHCKQGFYHSHRAGMCLAWSSCGTGTGVRIHGTPHSNTQCSPCINGTFSERISSEFSCSPHSQCPRSEIILKGSSWHDNICGSCEEARNHGEGHFLQRLLPSFLSHHAPSPRRLRHVVMKLPGPKPRTSRLNPDHLRTRLDHWVSEASARQIWTLPQILNQTGAVYTAERLLNKMRKIQANMVQMCPEIRTKPGLNQDYEI